MDLILELPEELRAILMNMICQSSKISLVVVAHVNKFCYRLSRKWAFIYAIRKELIYDEIASEGSLEVLKWEFSKWNSGISYGGSTCGKHLCFNAAENGHLEILKWARSNGFGWNLGVCKVAAQNGHLEVLEWAMLNGCEYDSDICSIIAQYGHVRILEWLKSYYHNWGFLSRDICRIAAQNGNLELLKWVRYNSCKCNKQVCKWATINGHLHVLQWARENGCRWDRIGTVNWAINGGHLEVLKWVLSNGCHMNYPTIEYARARWPNESF